MSEKILEVKHLGKAFGSNQVLRDIDFSVSPGDVTCIIGPSGSGKSTLLRCLNMLETPSTGEINYHGTDITSKNVNVPEYRSKVGMVFQNFNLFNNMTALKNCTVGQVKVLKKSKEEAEKKALYYLEKVGMAPYINAKPKQLSGGQKQRVAIARALAMEPEILLFDEPTSALDPQMVGEVLEVMRDLAHEGLTMIIVTHEMAFARDVSKRVIFMANGVIVEDRPPKELFENPKVIVAKTVDFGVYLAEDKNAGQEDRVLLPVKQVPEGTREGDTLDVFIYKDSRDRLIATTREPLLQVGQTAVLKVLQVTKIGAFLDWGLEKDLLLPYHEQTSRVREGQECLVALYVDKSSRLCATMKVYHYLSTRTPYVTGDSVKGRVYEISDRFGVFVAVDDKYSALIPAREASGKYRPGEVLDLRVSEVKEDGKMNVTDRQKAYIQINEDAESVLSIIEEFAGVLPFDDKASPEVIKREFGLSKNAFKRAVGHLLKEGKIEIKDKRIYKK